MTPIQTNHSNDAQNTTKLSFDKHSRGYYSKDYTLNGKLLGKGSF